MMNVQMHWFVTQTGLPKLYFIVLLVPKDLGFYLSGQVLVRVLSRMLNLGVFDKLFDC